MTSLKKKNQKFGDSKSSKKKILNQVCYLRESLKRVKKSWSRVSRQENKKLKFEKLTGQNKGNDYQTLIDSIIYRANNSNSHRFGLN